MTFIKLEGVSTKLEKRVDSVSKLEGHDRSNSAELISSLLTNFNKLRIRSPRFTMLPFLQFEFNKFFNGRVKFPSNASFM